MASRCHVVVFSDVDGVLLHPSAGSLARAAAALRGVADESVSVVLCSLKTMVETGKPLPWPGRRG